MKTYRWRAGAHKPKGLKAQEAISALAEIESREALTPEAIVRAAEDGAHPLHDAFEWDDTEAARAYRIDQARRLIRSIEVVIDRANAAPIQVNAYVSVQQQEEGRAYVRSEVALAPGADREAVLARAIEDLRAWQRRYYGLTELADILSAIERHAA